MNPVTNERFANYEDPVQIFSYSIPKETFQVNVMGAIESLTHEIGMIEFTLFTTPCVTSGITINLPTRAILLRLGNGELIIAEKVGKILGEGSLFSAQKVNTFSLSTKKYKFIVSKKTSDGKFLNEANNKNLIKEVNRQNVLAERVHHEGKVGGVVKPYFIAKAQGNIVGVFTKYFYGTLFNCCVPYDEPNVVPEMKFQFYSILSGFRYALEGLKKMHELGIYPGDVKPSNILYKGIKFAITDFGDANTKEKLEETLKSSISLRQKLLVISGTRTPLYSNHYDLVVQQQAVEDNDIKTLILVNEKCDIYAFGKTLYEVIIQKEVVWGNIVKKSLKPVERLEDCDEYFREIKQHLTKLGCPKKLISLVCSMVEPDYRLRPTASLVLEIFDEVIREKIEGDIQSLYSEVQKIRSLRTAMF